MNRRGRPWPGAAARYRNRLVAAGVLALALVAGAARRATASPASPPLQATPPAAAEPDTEAQLREGRALWERGALGPAMVVLERALAGLGPDAGPALEARCRNLIANVADSQGEFARGLEEHSAALRLAQRAGDRRLEAEVLADTGMGRWRCAEYRQALAALDRALTLQAELGLDVDRARTLVLIGRVHFKEGDYQQALDCHTRALALQEAAGDRGGAAVTLEDIGDVWLDRGVYGRALEHFERSLAVREALGDHAGQAWILTVMGTAYLLQGAFADAERSFLRSLAIAEAADDGAGRAEALYHLGIVHVRTGEYQRAVTALATAARLHETLADRRAMAWDLEFLGLARLRAGDPAGALRHYQQAAAVRETIHDLRGLASNLDAIGVVQEAMGAPADALATYRRALSLGEELHLPYVCLTLGRIGRVLAVQGHAAEALGHGRQAVARAHLLDSLGLVWQAEYHLAEIERRLGHREAALRALAKSMDAIEAMRAGIISGGESGASFLDDKQVVFGDAIALLFEAGRTGEALEIAERARARAFLDLLATRRSDAEGAPGASPPRGRPARGGEPAGSRPAGSHGGSDADTAAVGPRPATLASARDAARRLHVTMVDYFAGAESLFVWVVAADGSVAGKVIACPRRDLEALVEAARRDLGPGEGAALPPPAGDPWRRLYGLLVDPVAASLPADPETVVIVSPHGPLWSLPFAALRDGSGRRLIERHSLAYVPALGALAAAARGARPASARALVVGNPEMPELPDLGPLAPLPAAEREAAEIAAVLGGSRVTLLTGARARERDVRALAPGSAWLHFATHGVIRDDSPLDSLLVLVGDGRSADGDGRFTAREILGLHLDAELVVLSGCDTGRGRITGDGVLGLARAFLSAGSRAVLVSLSPVEDEAARTLMVRFYRELAHPGAGCPAALRRAQLAAVREPLARWAPYVLLAGSP